MPVGPCLASTRHDSRNEKDGEVDAGIGNEDEVANVGALQDFREPRAKDRFPFSLVDETLSKRDRTDLRVDLYPAFVDGDSISLDRS